MIIDKRLSIFFLLIGAGLLLRIPNLCESLWWDEAMYSTSQGADSLPKLLSLIVTDRPAPLYRAVLFFWTKFFGENEISVRMPSLAFGIGSIFLTYRVAEKQYSQKAAFMAALMMCFSPVHVWYSQEATPYSMAGFFLLASIFSYINLHRGTDSGKWWGIIYPGALFAAVFTHYYSIVFLLPISLMSLGADKRVQKRVSLAHAVIVILFFTTVLIKLHAGTLCTGMSFLRSFTLFEWWMLFFNWFLHGNSIWTVNPYSASLGYLIEHPCLIGLQLIFLFFLIRGFFIDRRNRLGFARWEYPLYLSVLPVTLLILTINGFRHLYIERYLLGLMPFFFIVIAGGIDGFKNKAVTFICIMLVAVVSIASYAMFLGKNDLWTVYKQNPDWRAAAQYLSEEQIFSKGAIVFFSTPADTLEFYLRKSGTKHSIQVEAFHPNAIEQKKRNNGRVIFSLIQNHYWPGKSYEVLNWLKSKKSLKLIDNKSFKGLQLFSFVSLPSY